MNNKILTIWSIVITILFGVLGVVTYKNYANIINIEKQIILIDQSAISWKEEFNKLNSMIISMNNALSQTNVKREVVGTNIETTLTGGSYENVTGASFTTTHGDTPD